MLDHGSNLRGEAVTLWRLSHDGDELRCFLVEPPRGFWLEPALARAEALRAPLVNAGWTDADADVPVHRRNSP